MNNKLLCELPRCKYIFYAQVDGKFICFYHRLLALCKQREKDYKKENKTYTNEKEVTLSNGIKNAKP